jgi:hypothetical protein
MTVSTSPLALNLALLSAAALGFRHGFDYDHVAAITDIASVQRTPWRAMRMGLLYALGHAATVAVLGVGTVALQLRLPTTLDHTMERVVGLTLLVLGTYVLWTTVFKRQPHCHGPRTRVILLANAALWVWWRVRRAFSGAAVVRRELFAEGFGKAPSFAVGVIHGLGAETPTQLMIFLLAANLGGVTKGVLGIAVFIAGMLAMNTLMCAAAAGVFRMSARRPGTMQWIAGLSAAYSILLGVLFIAGPGAVESVLHR